MAIEVDPRWYETFFEGEWLDEILLHVDDERTQAEVALLVEELGLEAGSRVLDLGCGVGRHAIELARRGCSVVGLDLSPRSLEVAREQAAATGVDVEWLHADMRQIGREDEFDAVYNYYSAFGYLESEAEDRKVLDAVARALRRDGRFLVEMVNTAALFRRFQPRSWQRLETGAVMIEEREYDFLEGRIRAVWTFVRDDGSRGELRHSLRAYTPAELTAMLRAAGLEVERAYGSTDRDELTLETWRLVLVARKP